MLKCKDCGAPIEENMNVCPYCGMNIKKTKSAEDVLNDVSFDNKHEGSPANTEERAKAVKLIAVIVIICFVVLPILFFVIFLIFGLSMVF